MCQYYYEDGDVIAISSVQLLPLMPGTRQSVCLSPSVLTAILQVNLG